MKKKLEGMNYFTKNSIFSYVTVILAYVIMQVLLSGGKISNSLSAQLVPICVYITMAVSLNLVVGISGELSLGHAGFMSIGAFSAVIAASFLSTKIASAPLVLILSIAVGAIMAGLFGIIIGIPVLRLKGDYLAIVTLAFGEIIKEIVNLVYCGIDEKGLHFSLTSKEALALSENGRMVINGPMGAVGVTKLSSFTAGLILVLIALFVVYNLCNSRTGRSIMAVRDNSIAAQSVGINTTKYRMIAFATASAIAGAAGGLYGLNFSSINSSKFDFNLSILVLVFVVLGGMGNIFGSVISATVLILLPELLRPIRDYRMLIYAIVLILLMLIRNSSALQGFFSKLTSKKEEQKTEKEAV